MRLGSLFSGIGGFDLAAHWMGWSTSWFSEIDPYAAAVLKKHWPDVPNLGDITQINGASVPPTDMLVGGFPCQDISLAGKGAGLSGERSGLWYHYARLIEEIRPRWIVAENVSALRARGLDKVLGSLAQIGYDAEWHCIPASAVGAPHQRDRIWIVAYPGGFAQSEPGHEADAISNQRDARLVTGWGRSRLPRGESGANVADSECERSESGTSGEGGEGTLRDQHRNGSLAQRGRDQLESRIAGSGTLADAQGVGRREECAVPGRCAEGSAAPRRDGERSVERCAGAKDMDDTIGARLEGHAGDGNTGGGSLASGSVAAAGLSRGAHAEGWWESEPNVGRVAHGVPARVDRLRCLGNALVPEIAYRIFRAIDAAEKAVPMRGLSARV